MSEKGASSLTSTSLQFFLLSSWCCTMKILIVNLHTKENSHKSALLILAPILRIRHNNMRTRKTSWKWKSSSQHFQFSLKNYLQPTNKNSIIIWRRPNYKRKTKARKRSQLLLFENSKHVTKWPNLAFDYDFIAPSASTEGLFTWIY